MTPSAPSAAVPVTSNYALQEPCLLVFSFQFAPYQTGNPPDSRVDVGVSIDKDSDFLLTKIYGASDNYFYFNFRLPSGRQFSNVLLGQDRIVGTLTQPTFIGPPVLYRAGSRIPLDLTNGITGPQTPGAGSNVTIVFSGIRLYR